MQRPAERPFTLLDAMILVASVALGLSVLRRWTGPHLFAPFGGSLSLSRRIHFLRQVLGILTLSWTPAALIVRLRRPRPPLREIARQPGLIASLAVTLAALNVLLLPTPQYLSAPRTYTWVQLALDVTNIRFVAPSIALAWIVLAVTGRWQAEASWIDRLGRWTGVIWLVFYVEMMLHIYWDTLA